MDVTLTAEPRLAIGSSVSRRLRAEGKVPAVVYGLGADPQAVTVEWTALRKALITEAGLNALIELSVGGDTNLSIIKDLQRHPIRKNVLHVDFQLIDRNAPITIDVPVVLIGEAEKVEQLKGMIDQLRHTLAVKAVPGNFPNQLEVDISHLEIGTNVKVGEVPLPDGVSTDVDPEEPIAQGSATRSTILLQNEGKGDGEGGEGADGEGGESDDDADGGSDD